MAKGNKIPLQIRADQLRLLQEMSNSCLSSPASIRMNPPPSSARSTTESQQRTVMTTPTAPHRPALILFSFLFDVAHGWSSPTTYPDALSFINSLKPNTRESMGTWLPRIGFWATAIEEDPDTNAVVAGTFRVAHSEALVLALMRYSPGALEGERYAVQSSLFCMTTTEK